MADLYPFNVRVYGILINDQNQILISDEEEFGFRFTKYPGGGLEFGEGLIDGLKREFQEECAIDVEVSEHLYTSDFFVKSAFNESQVISVYYRVEPLNQLQLNFKQRAFDFDMDGDVKQAFRWINIENLDVEEITFPADKRVTELVKLKWKKV